MIRAAAKNHARRRRRRQARELRRRARRAARRATARSPPGPATGSPTRPSPHTARYDAAISRWFGERLRGLPGHTWPSRLREVHRPLLRREPAPAGGALHRGRARAPTCSRGSRKLHGKDALVQQRARPRLGAPPARRLRRPGLRDRQAQQPVRGRGRRRRSSTPTRRRSPATRSRPSAA